MKRNVLNCRFGSNMGWDCGHSAVVCDQLCVVVFLGFRPLSSVLVRAVPELLDNFINNSLRTILRFLL